jgi:phenylalanyl-tRNA synthetase alpha chain
MSTLKKHIEQYQKDFLNELKLIKTAAEFEPFRFKHLSRQGLLSDIVNKLKELNLEEKKVVGPLINTLKNDLQQAFKEREEQIIQERAAAEKLRTQHFDVTAYLPFQKEGTLHPYTLVIEQAENIFLSMGFDIVDGPEVEHEFYNFEALNIPEDHPARDMQDTFWLTLPNYLMRTHTSSVEIHSMKTRKPPIAIVVPGRAYRNEATDASHDFMFMQLEGLFIDKKVSLAQLIATMKTFLQTFFEKKDLLLQIRPSYFPFVEPGVEIDMSCPFCTKGCSVCGRTMWIEICGAGLTHPHVLKACDLDPKEYSGFAFGFGLTRLVMLKYGITDIRLLHSNKLGFLKQF